MARFSITLIDDADGSGRVMPEFDPPLRALLERRRAHGDQALSNAEGMGIILAESLVRASEPVITTSPSGIVS
jgi:hypothetical protein